jgi:poly-gamma-glutamate synthesis protein (capsule biosynthesis protein)
MAGGAMKNLFLFIIFLLFISPSYGKEDKPEETMSFALTGDSIITMKISVFDEPAYMDMINIIRSSDVAVTNFEGLFHNYEGYPSAQSGGTYVTGEPELAGELTWAGFDMLCRANNHALDYGYEGVKATDEALKKEGLVYGGVGENLALARSPVYLDTKKGRVGLISCTSTFPRSSAAGHQRADMKGRPGVNPLRYSTRYIVDNQTFMNLYKMVFDLKLSHNIDEQSLSFLNLRFEKGDKCQIITEPDRNDLEEIKKSIKEARNQADWVIFSLHSHEGMADNYAMPAAFVQTVAREAIDGGADIFFSHGAHLLKGIEIYKKKPIFYGLGNFIFQIDTIKYLPDDLYERYNLSSDSLPSDIFNTDRYNNCNKPENWETVIALPVFDGKKQLKEIRLYPVSLGFKKGRTKRGRPVPASEELSRSMIERLKSLSSPFGTEIFYENNIFVVKIAE